MEEKHDRSYYLRLRRKFQPKSVNLAIIAESPPASGKYFYDERGQITEPLFKALMQQTGFEVPPKDKTEGLSRFQNMGWVLVDATYEPVNRLSGSERDQIIEKSYPSLFQDIKQLRASALILIKKNVCQVLEPKLREDGFEVLNRGRAVYFPSHGRQPDFHRQFGEIIAMTKI